MIIAWGLFIVSSLTVFLGIFIVPFANKENLGELKYEQSDLREIVIFFLVSLCSAQYIWG